MAFLCSSSSSSISLASPSPSPSSAPGMDAEADPEASATPCLVRGASSHDGEQASELRDSSKKPKDEAISASHATRDTSTRHGKHKHDDEHASASAKTKETSMTRQENRIHEGEKTVSSHESSVRSKRHEKHSHDVEQVGSPHERNDSSRSPEKHGHNGKHGGNLSTLDNESDLKRALSDENSSRERILQLSYRSGSPDIDAPTQRMHASSNTKYARDGSKATSTRDICQSSTDGSLETPSSSWAFCVTASIAPSKFDHMATLKATFNNFKESKDGKEGVSLSLLPEILESARFMVPPPRDLVELLQRIDVDYKPGDIVRWHLLHDLGMQIERKEARYPPVFNPRFSPAKCADARAKSISPNTGKGYQRSPTRRTHPEDVYPELEPQVYEMMKEIDNHRRTSAKKGNYLAADAAAQRLLELKLFEANKRRATMMERHAQEREQAEKAYKEELQERTKLWDERLKSFQKEIVDQAQRVKQKHITELQHLKESWASKTRVKAQWSTELLIQRRIQACLGKQGKYLEAQEIKLNADRMEQAELQAAVASYNAEFVSKDHAMRLKHQNEMNNFLQKTARSRDDIAKSRKMDLHSIHQRHKNVIRELAAIQKQEVFRFDQLMQKKVHNPHRSISSKSRRIPRSSSSLRYRVTYPDYSTDDAIYSGGED